jgi:hypothetical protein
MRTHIPVNLYGKALISMAMVSGSDLSVILLA